MTFARTISIPTLLGGIAAVLFGAWLFSFFSPSPHGYLQVFVAVPVVCLGLACAGAAFLVDSPHYRAVRYTIGGVLLAAAAAPFLIALSMVLWVALR